MYDMHKSNDCGCSSRPEHDDRKEEVCDIESKCCEGFVKEQFTIRTTATTTPVVVYKSNNCAITRATIKVRNLSPIVTINVSADDGTSHSTGNIIGPNQEAVFTIDLLTQVAISTQTGTARVLLCFDLQVCSFNENCNDTQVPCVRTNNVN